MFITIKGIQHEIIEENGIKYYKNHCCKCPDHEKIIVIKSHEKHGIPMYKSGHQFKGKNNPNIGNHISESHKNKIRDANRKRIGRKVTLEGIENMRQAQLKNYKENPERKEKLRIAFSGSGNPMFNVHMCGEDHWNYEQTTPLETRQKQSEANKGKKPNLKTREKMRKSRLELQRLHPEIMENLKNKKIKYYKNYPEAKKNDIQAALKYWKDNPDKMIENIKNMHKIGKMSDTKIEIKTHTYLKEIFINDIIIKQHGIVDPEKNKIYIVDFFIPKISTIIEVNGCYHHCCIDCNRIKENISRTQEIRLNNIKKKNYLEQMGFNVIIIWEHDIKNGKYKEILNELKERLQ